MLKAHGDEAPTLLVMLEEMLADANHAATERNLLLRKFTKAAPDDAAKAVRESEADTIT